MFELKLWDGNVITFKPDFLLPQVKIDGKTVQLETHASRYFDKNFVLKLNAAMNDRRFSSENYLILITDGDCNEYINCLLGDLHLTRRDICNEMWLKKIDDNESLVTRLKDLRRRAEYMEIGIMIPTRVRSRVARGD